ncbi:hypothetical protein LWI29_031918 [Acer saccharum]|uniref:Uncharacterized protein n=1 Tax=Acer saccharum TaxID=4024 RepID=A0AA39SMS1_ACESA|nr:hypothetical protein LWI29_031918 [Acer saccharum]
MPPPCLLTPPTAATVLSSSTTPRLHLGYFSLVDDAAWSDRSSQSTLQLVFDSQEALLNLGFYFSEEDMEFSNFSTGTEHAVKTWQKNYLYLASETASSSDGEQQWMVAEDSVDEKCSDGDKSDDADRGATTTVSSVPFSLCSDGERRRLEATTISFFSSILFLSFFFFTFDHFYWRMVST